MNKLKPIIFLLIIISSIFISGCATRDVPAPIIEYRETKCAVTLPDNVQLIKFPFYDIEADGIKWIALDAKGYESLSTNMANLKKYIKQSSFIIDKCVK